MSTSSFISVYLNSLSFVWSNLVATYIGCVLCFRRRNSPALLIGYFLVEGALRAYIDTYMAFGSYGGVFFAVTTVWSCVSAVLVYMVLYYTWKESILAIGLVGLLLDLLNTPIATVCTVLVNGLTGRGFQADFHHALSWDSAIQAVLMVALFAVAVYVAHPYLRRICNHEFRHPRIWMLVIVAGVALSTASRIYNPGGYELTVYVLLAWESIAIALIAAMALWLALANRRNADALRRSVANLEAYNQAISSQADMLQQGWETLERLYQRVGVEDAGSAHALRIQMESLRSLSSQVRHGSYSDSPLLDALLTDYARQFEGMSLAVDFRVREVGESPGGVIDVAQAMLDWAVGLAKAGRLAVGSPVVFGLARQAGLVVASLQVQAPRKVSFPGRALRRPRGNVQSVHQSFERGACTVLVGIGKG